MSRQYTQAQQNVIDLRGRNMLVSASAGTGKTTVMIERIANLIKEGLGVDQMVVVTFTNLAAAEMKGRLEKKLTEYAQNDANVRDQLEKLDCASICTLHSFCSDLLRNYFYVADIDPSFGILDSVTVNALKKNALDELFKEYFSGGDQEFEKLYRIFATNRKEENFKDVVLDLHNFSRNVVNFEDWYKTTRQFTANGWHDSPIAKTLLTDIAQTVAFCKENMRLLANRCLQEGAEILTSCCHLSEQTLAKIDLATLQSAINGICTAQLEKLPRKNKKASEFVDVAVEDQIRDDYKEVSKIFEKLAENYANIARGNNIETMWQETEQSMQLCDKLAEIVVKFEDKFFSLKKQLGGVDFNDLEHLALKILEDEPTLKTIKDKYKMIFVDEYQDTNPVQEAIVSKLCSQNGLFMVGDIKQSIYGFRGCEPNIFLQKYRSYKQNDGGVVEELNDNFRSNCQILDFVNFVFSKLMTERFGKVNYKDNAQFAGATQPIFPLPSVSVDFVLKEEQPAKEIVGLYDVTQTTGDEEERLQALAIAQRIKQTVGIAYKDKDGTPCRIQYGDIVILMRSLTHKATDLYNVLVENNIPVTASFKVEGFATKEIREIVNLLRVLDNPYNDIYLVGVCLSAMGGFCENDLAQIRLNTQGRIPFYDRLQQYAKNFDDVITNKITTLIELLDNLRFYSRGASVCEVVLRVLRLTNFHLYVQGLPNGAIRLRKLYNFVDNLKNANYATAIDKFLHYIDETNDARSEESLSSTNAVRLMTMHASKGLEFPVVILAGLESTFVFDTRAVERNAELGLATKCYDFGNMKKYQTLSATACSLLNKTKQREEEMRLLYVAMTRAKQSLVLVSTVTEKQLNSLPKQPSKATNCADWLLYCLKQNYPHLQAEGRAFEIRTVQEFGEIRQKEQNFLCEQYTDADAVLQKLNYVYPYKQQTAMPLKVVSSALDKLYFEDEELNSAPVLVEDDKNKVGTAYHTIYQYVDYDADIEQIQSTVNQLVESGKLDETYATRLDLQLIYDTLQNPQLRDLMNQGQVYHEYPFMLYAPYDQLARDKRFSDDVMLQGVIDLLVIGQDKAVVVDFKYTSRSDKVKNRYPYQLNSYRLAVQKICGIQNVDCYILSIADNKLIKM